MRNHPSHFSLMRMDTKIGCTYIDMMNLFNIIYVSKYNDAVCNSSEVTRIIEVSQKNNLKNEITGILVFGEDFFLQLLEGDQTHINSLYDKIRKDPRHFDAVLLEDQKIEKRLFPNWSMKDVVFIGHLQKHLTLEFSPDGDFDPYTLDGESAKRLLISLSAH